MNYCTVQFFHTFVWEIKRLLAFYETSYVSACNNLHIALSYIEVSIATYMVKFFQQ